MQEYTCKRGQKVKIVKARFHESACKKAFRASYGWYWHECKNDHPWSEVEVINNCGELKYFRQEDIG